MTSNLNFDLNKEFEQLKEYEKYYKYFSEIYDEIYKKYKGEFVAVKDKQIFHNKDLDSLLTTLKNNNIEPANTFIEFIKDQEIIYV